MLATHKNSNKKYVYETYKIVHVCVMECHICPPGLGSVWQISNLNPKLKYIYIYVY